MYLNKRKKPTELLLFEYLLNRKTLTQQELLTYKNLWRGYQGEVLFDSYLEELSCDSIVLRDVWLSKNNRIFQLDHLLFYKDCIYMFEVKNYSGDFYYENEKLYKETGQEIDDPLIQLKRSESLLRQLLKSLGYHYHLESKVVFINSECTIYQAPRNTNILLPTQINRYFKQFQPHVSLNHKFPQLAKKLTSIQLKQSPYRNIINYNYSQLKKGIPYILCRQFLNVVKGKQTFCHSCNNREFVNDSVLRNLKEYMLLFPKERITIEKMQEWCNLPISNQRMRYILKKYLSLEGNTKGAYYIPIE